MSGTITIDTVEVVHLELAYAHTRIQRPRQIVHLADSLIRHGQLLPIVVVADAEPRWVLIDGYQRVAAARRAGLDTLQAHIWPGRAQDALCQLLARDGARQFDVFEQAALLRELKITHRFSQHQIASAMGRHPSWVTRRLSLIEALPELAARAVRSGQLSSWSASRVLVPLARANPEHAEALVAAIKGHPVTSRQLLSFFRHYQSANRGLRQKMVDEPVLFFKSLTAKAAELSDRQTRDGPEGRWCRDMRTAGHILTRLDEMAPQVFFTGQTTLQRRTLLTAANHTRTVFEKLNDTIKGLTHEKRSRQTSGHRHERRRPEHSPDQPHHEDVAKDNPAHPDRQCARSGRALQSL
ncbi:MAG: ParB/RepB/Spo0J family partition protein [Pseudodesulfovibrio sp.]|nr:ParB/RepB/Spo0J family partition protein [Pseudodesulfovibrio sp.]